MRLNVCLAAVGVAKSVASFAAAAAMVIEPSGKVAINFGTVSANKAGA